MFFRTTLAPAGGGLVEASPLVPEMLVRFFSVGGLYCSRGKGGGGGGGRERGIYYVAAIHCKWVVKCNQTSSYMVHVHYCIWFMARI